MKTKDLIPHFAYVRGFQRMFALAVGNAKWKKADRAMLRPLERKYFGKKRK